MVQNVLEIGFGGDPMGISHWHPNRSGPFMASTDVLDLFAKTLPMGVNYVGIDFPGRLRDTEVPEYGRWCQRDISYSRKTFEAYQQDKSRWPGISLQEMDARELQFANGQFGEVHLHYVVTDPSVRQEDAERIIAEAKRVLNPEGVLVLSGERYATRANMIQNLETYVRGLLSASGIVVDEEKDALERSSLLAPLVKALFGLRMQTDGRDYAPEAFLLISKSPGPLR